MALATTLVLIGFFALLQGGASAAVVQPTNCTVSLEPGNTGDFLIDWDGDPTQWYEINVDGGGATFTQGEGTEVTYLAAEAGVSYAFSVAPYNNQGPFVPCGSITYPITEPPARVAQCSVAPEGNEGVTIEFTKTPGAVGFELWRNGAPIAEGTNHRWTEFYDQLPPETLLHYSIATIGSNGQRSARAYCGSYDFQAFPRPEAVASCGTVANGTNPMVVWTPRQPDSNTGYTIRRNGVIYAEGITGTSWTDPSVVPGRTYHYSVIGESGPARSWAEYCGSQVAPAGPSVPNCSVVGSDTARQITISWDQVAGSTGYRIFRNGDWASTRPADESSWVDDDGTDLVPGVDYTYTISALDADENVSPATACGTASVSAFIPLPPLNCTVTQVGLNEFNLPIVEATWTAAEPGLYYTLWANGVERVFGGEPDPGTLRFTTGGSFPATFHFSVASWRNGVDSATRTYCGSLVLNTDGAGVPVRPAWCSATLQADGTVAIDWDPNGDDRAEQYVVRRSRNDGQYYWAGLVNAPTLTYTDANNLRTGDTYAYTVQTVHLDGTQSEPTTCWPPVTIGDYANNL